MGIARDGVPSELSLRMLQEPDYREYASAHGFIFLDEHVYSDEALSGVGADCSEVIELGPPNASIHQIDEHITLTDIESLTAIYRCTLDNLADFAQAHPAA